jgi:hypothetical protein
MSKEISNPLTAFKAVTIFNLDINYTTGFKKLPKKEEERLYGQLPPEQFITSGQAKLYPRSEIQNFDTIRVYARNLCRQAGISFMGGFAIPDHRVPDLVNAIEEQRARYLDVKANFIATAAAKSNEWIETAPDQYKPILRSCTYSEKELDSKLGFEYSYFRIAAIESEDGSVVSEGLVKQASSMSDKLLEEIQKDALEAWTQTLSKKDQCSQSTVNRIRKLLDKLNDLAWLSPKTTAISDEASAIVNALPDKGPITGKDFMSFRYLVLVLSDPEKINSLADANWKNRKADSQNEVLDLAPAAKPKPTVEATDVIDDDSEEEEIDMFGSQATQIQAPADEATIDPTFDDEQVDMFGINDETKVVQEADANSVCDEASQEDEIIPDVSKSNTSPKENGKAAIREIKSIFDCAPEDSATQEQHEDLDLSAEQISDNPSQDPWDAGSKDEVDIFGVHTDFNPDLSHEDDGDDDEIDMWGTVSPSMSSTQAVDDVLSRQGGADFPVTDGF